MMSATRPSSLQGQHADSNQAGSLNLDRFPRFLPGNSVNTTTSGGPASSLPSSAPVSIPLSSSTEDTPTSQTRTVDVQAGPSMIISINSVPLSRLPKRKKAGAGHIELPPPKTVKIAPFNRPPTLSSISPSNAAEPEILSVAGGGKSTLCFAVPVSPDKVPSRTSLPGSEMVSMGNGGAFVACVPVSCQGKFSPSLCPGNSPNCFCKMHILQQANFKPALQKFGVTRKKPLVIDDDDDDDDEVILLDDNTSSTNMTSPAKESNDLLSLQTSSDNIENTTTELQTPPKDPMTQTPQKDPMAQTPQKDPMAQTPQKDPMAQTPQKDPMAQTPQKDPMAQTPNSPQQTQIQPQMTPTSPRHRARLSAVIKSGEKCLLAPFSPAVRTLDLSTTSLAHIAARFSDRKKAIERAEISSATSAISESSETTSSTSSKPEDENDLSNPESLLKILQQIKQDRPFKKLRVTARNLYQAVKSKHLSKVLALIVEGCRPNVQVDTEKGRTALHAAAAGGYLDIITCLKMAGGDLDVLDYDMRTPLFDAVENGQLKTVEYLIHAGASILVRDQGGMTLLHVASRRGHNNIIRILLDTRKFDINQKDDGGWTAIMWAAEDKMVETAKLLLARGGNVHLRDLELNIPLHWAAFAGSFQMSLLLIDNCSDIHAINRHGETPIHIAARENNYSCVQLFLNRGSRVDVYNKEGQTPLEVATLESRSRQLIETRKLLAQCQPQARYKLLSCDISRGQENVAIPCINEVDDEPFPPFTFIKECCEVGGAAIEYNINTIQACICEGDCGNNPSCSCGKMCDEETIWYDQDGLLCPEIHKLDRPLLFECNKMCKCWSYCRNRVVQKGMQYPLQLFKTQKKGWGVRALCDIPKGTFLCEYTGELISDSEANSRESDTYLFDLDCKESEHELFCIDGVKYGNVSRFINHSCEPNCSPTRVFSNHQDIRFPRIAFFASKDIEMYGEICFNYGDRFWEVKKEEFYCQCGTSSCNYKAPSH